MEGNALMNIDEKELIEMLAKAHRAGRFFARTGIRLGDNSRTARNLPKTNSNHLMANSWSFQQIDQEVAHLLVAKEKEKQKYEQKIESGRRLDDPQTQKWIEAFKVDSQWQSTTFTSTPSTITNWFWEEWKSSEDRRDRPENEK
jgi:methyl coenzyme M reductase gamma subunit